MFAWAKPLAAIAALCLLAEGALAEGKYGLGRVATAEEIAGWDVDIRPDGHGLPPGSGSVLVGEEIYLEQCAVCHGEFGEGAGRYPVLMGGFDTLVDDRPEKTVGSYWPYASTVWDYVYRAMPFGFARSLSADDTYAVTAYLLYLNDVVDEEFVLSQENFSEVRMPNEAGFFVREQPDVPKGEPCMKDCKDKVEVVGRAVILDVTPDEAQPVLD